MSIEWQYTNKYTGFLKETGFIKIESKVIQNVNMGR
jgi:hypothetical protein